MLKAEDLLSGGAIIDPDEEFWDVQAVRRSHVLRIVSENALEYRHAGVATWMPVDVHLVLHEAGFALLRLTVAPAGMEHAGSLIDLLRMHHASIFESQGFEWRFTSGAGRVSEGAGEVRFAMDALMFGVHEGLMGREASLGLDGLESFEERYKWLEARERDGEIETCYPVVFGTAAEVMWPRLEDRVHNAGELSGFVYGSSSAWDDTKRSRPAETGPNHDWFLSENRSILSMTQSSGPSLSVLDPMRMQLLEYLTLQRSALRAVQRGTQLVITERRVVTRQRLQRWQRLVGAMTDDYVLHDQVCAILLPLRSHLRDHPGVRDPGDLEAQVRRNLEVFRGLVDAASARVAIVLSGLFGVVAAVSLGGLARRLELFGTGGSSDPNAFDYGHLGLSIGIDVGLLVTVAIVVGFVMRYAGRVRGPGR